MKKLLLAILTVLTINIGIAEDANTPSNISMPDLSWVKTEVRQIIEQKPSNSGENIAAILKIDLNTLTSASLVIASGHFTDKENKQMLITIPGTSKDNSNLGWETNLWLLVQKDSANNYKTIASIRGDVAYQNSVIDMDGDGYDEISMINRTVTSNVQRIAYKLFSFKSKSVLYVSETEDRWSMNKDNVRRTIAKGELLYNVLETQFVDIDNDGKMEIVEKWIEFRHNGGKRIKDIEQRKTMKIRSRILTIKDGTYQ